MDEVWADEILLTFDGRVVEVFGFPGSESIRFHVLNLELSAEGPDRKGRTAGLALLAGAAGLALKKRRGAKTEEPLDHAPAPAPVTPAPVTPAPLAVEPDPLAPATAERPAV